MRRMWKDIRALQKFTVNRGLVKWVIEEAVECEVTDEMVERVAIGTQDLVLGRMQSNSLVPPLNLVIWDTYLEIGNPDEGTSSDGQEASELKDLAAEFKRYRREAVRKHRADNEGDVFVQ